MLAYPLFYYPEVSSIIMTPLCVLTFAVKGGLAGVLVTAAGPLGGQQVGAHLLHPVADGAARPESAGAGPLSVIRHIHGTQPAAVGLLPDTRTD